MLGKNDSDLDEDFLAPLGLTDKMFNSLFSSLMRNLDKQFKEQAKSMQNGMSNDERTEIRHFPNGIRIKISGPMVEKCKPKAQKITPVQQIEDEQIKKISSLPKEKAKTNVKRLGDRVVYELLTPGVISPKDIFISKLESGYEIKAIGNKKIYVNNIPINLPLSKYSIINNKLSVEFSAHDEQ